MHYHYLGTYLIQGSPEQKFYCANWSMTGLTHRLHLPPKLLQSCAFNQHASRSKHYSLCPVVRLPARRTNDGPVDSLNRLFQRHSVLVQRPLHSSIIIPTSLIIDRIHLLMRSDTCRITKPHSYSAQPIQRTNSSLTNLPTLPRMC